MNAPENDSVKEVKAELEQLRVDVKDTYSKALADRLESLDAQIAQLRTDMREDITRIEGSMMDGLTRLQWWLIGVLGSVVIGMLIIILRSL